MNSGVYRIINTITGCTYIGSSKNISLRFRYHRWLLNEHRCQNKHLQRSWNKYGEAAFVFEPLIECCIENLMVREQQFIDAYHNHNMQLYNLAPSSRSFVGFPISDETRRRKSLAGLGRIVSAETRRKISLANKGRRSSPEVRAHMWPPERKAILEEANRARIWTPERRAKLSASVKKTMENPELRRKISAVHKGSRHSPETKAKMSVSQTGKKHPHSLATRKKISQLQTGRLWSYNRRQAWLAKNRLAEL